MTRARRCTAVPRRGGHEPHASGARLFVAVYDGLVVFDGKRWERGPKPRNDYMGFTATRKLFFSSGHPGPGSGDIKPLGLIESDFHLLAAGFENEAVYVYSAAPNFCMKQAGIHYTLNQGFTWQGKVPPKELTPWANRSEVGSGKSWKEIATTGKAK